MKKLTLPPAQEQILRDQVIDADRPGPVLHDFQVVLDFVGPQGVKAGGKYHLLPLEAIPLLDERLHRPLRLRLQRPQLRSHPYLQGLHLLLRASGLTRVEGSGQKARLVVDPVVLDSWNGLNLTEQYFTLLEAWLFNGRAEMIGERGGWADRMLANFVGTWHILPPEHRRFEEGERWHSYLFGLRRQYHQLALMDLFGLASVEHPPKNVSSWAPAGVKVTPFGAALLTLIAEALPDWEDEEDSELQASPFGRLQEAFQPYFPAWQDNLVLPQPERRKGTFVFRVSLGKVWRRIAIGANATVHTLVESILDSVDFDDDHLYAFCYTNRLGATVEVNHPLTDEGPFGDEVKIGDLAVQPGESIKLIYDFGDNWHFDVRLESIDPSKPKGKLPRVIEKHGKAPEQYPAWD